MEYLNNKKDEKHKKITEELEKISDMDFNELLKRWRDLHIYIYHFYIVVIPIDDIKLKIQIIDSYNMLLLNEFEFNKNEKNINWRMVA